MRTTGKQCGLAATGVYQPSLCSPWLAATENAQVDHGFQQIGLDQPDEMQHGEQGRDIHQPVQLFPAQ
ncbi:hypothetical protein, partial [Thiolapillus sp.]